LSQKYDNIFHAKAAMKPQTPQFKDLLMINHCGLGANHGEQQ